MTFSTQSEEDTFISSIFGLPGIFEMTLLRDGKRWRVFFGEHNSGTGNYEFVDGNTPAEAIRAARARMVARKLTK